MKARRTHFFILFFPRQLSIFTLFFKCMVLTTFLRGCPLFPNHDHPHSPFFFLTVPGFPHCLVCFPLKFPLLVSSLSNRQSLLPPFRPFIFHLPAGPNFPSFPGTAFPMRRIRPSSPYCFRSCPGFRAFLQIPLSPFFRPDNPFSRPPGPRPAQTPSISKVSYHRPTRVKFDLAFGPSLF